MSVSPWFTPNQYLHIFVNRCSQTRLKISLQYYHLLVKSVGRLYSTEPASTHVVPRIILRVSLVLSYKTALIQMPFVTFGKQIFDSIL